MQLQAEQAEQRGGVALLATSAGGEETLGARPRRRLARLATWAPLDSPPRSAPPRPARPPLAQVNQSNGGAASLSASL